jgi:hypothetical protein
VLVAAGLTRVAAANDWCRTLEAWQSKVGVVPEAVHLICSTQGECDLPSVRDAFIGGEQVVTFRVHLVVFRDDEGADPAATEEELTAQMARLNDDFAPSGFAFASTWEYVDDTEFRYSGDAYRMKALYARDPEHQCNVYVTGNASYGVFPWDPDALSAQGGIVVNENYFDGTSSVITHEMGHNLGLWHTHHGVTEIPECSACWEAADGHGGDVTGDFCADTPPTPRNDLCNDPGSFDNCGDVKWGPTLPQDYMSYGMECWSLFTEQQASRMRCWSAAMLPSWRITCPGDGNGDGIVNSVDMQDLLLAWGTSYSTFDIAPPGGDAIIDIRDLIALLSAWAPCP